ncbi:flavin prenyltransferase UbiX [Microtetraspora sp. NBRC 13810]|uniref:UbiX family flavin prenyltransferase n=1 Tax=Microtetraspora sp. NBRC 13810 TaxID=3030990 RepID=UPI0024A42062|nr:UbiX family flavin prenyltransferase [Microtetraspora sp. NBRC 13810]GLW11109.1 flavin prenyltransferase UbiX [Microtetraspora sp. NBRC 13810]
MEPVDHRERPVNTPIAGAPRRVVVGVSGATGTALAVRTLQLLGAAGVERHLVVSPAARRTAAYEMPDARLERDAEVVHSFRDIGASIASGSYPVDAMIVIPCSVKTLGAIAAGVSENLLVRAADVTLKERRRLVLCVRETPLHLGHLRAMVTATEIGAIIAPPMPAFYSMPESLDDVVDHIVARALSLIGVHVPGAPPWQGEPASAARTARDGAQSQAGSAGPAGSSLPESGRPSR